MSNMIETTRDAYEDALRAMRQFCMEETELEPEVCEDQYPYFVTFGPQEQTSLFDSEDGEGKLIVTVGLQTTVLSTLHFNLDERVLKKLIRFAKAAGQTFYHKFRSEAANT